MCTLSLLPNGASMLCSWQLCRITHTGASRARRAVTSRDACSTTARSPCDTALPCPYAGRAPFAHPDGSSRAGFS